MSEKDKFKKSESQSHARASSKESEQVEQGQNKATDQLGSHLDRAEQTKLSNDLVLACHPRQGVSCGLPDPIPQQPVSHQPGNIISDSFHALNESLEEMGRCGYQVATENNIEPLCAALVHRLGEVETVADMYSNDPTWCV